MFMDAFEVLQLYGITVAIIAVLALFHAFNARRGSDAVMIISISAIVMSMLAGLMFNVGSSDSNATEYEYGEVSEAELYDFSVVDVSPSDLRGWGAEDSAYVYELDRGGYDKDVYVMVVKESEKSVSYKIVYVPKNRAEVKGLSDGESPHVEIHPRTATVEKAFGHKVTDETDYEYVIHVNGDDIAEGGNSSLYGKSSKLLERNGGGE